MYPADDLLKNEHIEPQASRVVQVVSPFESTLQWCYSRVLFTWLSIQVQESTT